MLVVAPGSGDLAVLLDEVLLGVVHHLHQRPGRNRLGDLLQLLGPELVDPVLEGSVLLGRPRALVVIVLLAEVLLGMVRHLDRRPRGDHLRDRLVVLPPVLPHALQEDLVLLDGPWALTVVRPLAKVLLGVVPHLPHRPARDHLRDRLVVLLAVLPHALQELGVLQRGPRALDVLLEDPGHRHARRPGRCSQHPRHPRRPPSRNPPPRHTPSRHPRRHARWRPHRPPGQAGEGRGCRQHTTGKQTRTHGAIVDGARRRSIRGRRRRTRRQGRGRRYGTSERPARSTAASSSRGGSSSSCCCCCCCCCCCSCCCCCTSSSSTGSRRRQQQRSLRIRRW